MNSEIQFIGWHGIAVLILYAVFLLGMVIYAAAKKNVGDNMKNFYISGGGLGAFLLFFTLYATQYSGNAVIGYAPRAYRLGYAWIQSGPFMIMVIVGYLLFAPRLHILAKRYNFITPSDWLAKRFESKAVTLVGTLLMCYGLANYLLEQLVAMGHAISGLTAGTIPYIYGVLFLVVVMLVYEWFGGMKGVAVADTINGIAILVGVIGFLILTLQYVGSFTETAQYIAATAPKKIGVPPLSTSINWLSMYLLIGVGAAVYPHAIQRIYAASSEHVLKKALCRMAWMPFFTTGVVFIIGIIGIKAIPGLATQPSEKLVGLLANMIAHQSTFNYWMMMILYTGVVGAIMSTTDSVVLSLSSMLSNDIYGRFIKPEASERAKVVWGKIAGILVVFLLVIVAWKPPATLYEIFVLKFEILIQVAPAFLIGLYWERLGKQPVLYGMIAGALVAAFMTFTGIRAPHGIHAGIIGLAANIAICVFGSLLAPAADKDAKIAQVLSIDRM